MYAVVVKPFTAYGQRFEPGDTVDISDFPKGDVLKRTRYLRDATVDEVQRATGESLPAPSKASPHKEQTPATARPAKAGKPKTVAAQAAPSAAPPPLRQSRQARAKAART